MHSIGIMIGCMKVSDFMYEGIYACSGIGFFYFIEFFS
jgi:hypothetical protein